MGRFAKAVSPKQLDHLEACLTQSNTQEDQNVYANLTLLRAKVIQQLAEEDFELWAGYLERRLGHVKKAADKEKKTTWGPFLNWGKKNGERLKASTLTNHVKLYKYIRQLGQTIKAYLRKLWEDAPVQDQKAEDELVKWKEVLVEAKKLQTDSKAIWDLWYGNKQKKDGRIKVPPMWMTKEMGAAGDVKPCREHVPYPEDGDEDPFGGSFGEEWAPWAKEDLIMQLQKVDAGVDLDEKIFRCLTARDSEQQVPDISDANLDDLLGLLPSMFTKQLTNIKSKRDRYLTDLTRSVLMVRQSTKTLRSKAKELKANVDKMKKEAADLQARLEKERNAEEQKKQQEDLERTNEANERKVTANFKDAKDIAKAARVFDNDNAEIDLTEPPPSDDEAANTRGWSAKPTSVHVADDKSFEPGYQFPDDEWGKRARQVWEQERFSIENQCCTTLLDPTGTFCKKNKDKFHLVFADIPWGVLDKQGASDRRLDADTVRKVILGAKEVCHPEGSIVIRMGEHDHDLWWTKAYNAGLYPEAAKRVIVQDPPWCRRKEFATFGNAIIHHYYMIIHLQPSVGRRSPHYRAATHYGGVEPYAKMLNPTVYLKCKHVPNNQKLKKDGVIVRVQENHLEEIAQLVHEFCPPHGAVLDFMAGTLTTLLACIKLNRVCVNNEIDKECVEAATSRAKQFLMYILQEDAVAYPEVHKARVTRFDGVCVLTAFFKFLNVKANPAGALIVPPNNEPWGFPKKSNDDAVKLHNESEGLLVDPSVTLSGAGVAENNKGLFLIRSVKKGEVITQCWGKYTTRCPKDNDDNVRVIEMTTNVPKGQHLYMKTDDGRMAAGYINDPSLHASTSNQKVNVEFVETWRLLDDPNKVVVIALTDIEASRDNPVECFADYQLKTVNSKTRKGGSKRVRGTGKLAQIATQPKKQRRRVSLPGTTGGNGEEPDDSDADSLGSAEPSYSDGDDEDDEGNEGANDASLHRAPTEHRHNTRSRNPNPNLDVATHETVDLTVDTAAAGKGEVEGGNPNPNLDVATHATVDLAVDTAAAGKGRS